MTGVHLPETQFLMIQLMKVSHILTWKGWDQFMEGGGLDPNLIIRAMDLNGIFIAVQQVTRSGKEMTKSYTLEFKNSALIRIAETKWREQHDE